MKTVLIIALLGLASFAQAATKWYQLDGYTFEKYIHEHNKKYASDEEHEFRRQIFEEKLAKIRQHNSDNTKTWKEGVNQFTDRTQEEFSKSLGLNKALLYSQKFGDSIMQKSEASLEFAPEPPVAVDWRTKGIISAVKDQGECGSCWTFGTAEIIESYYALLTGELQDLSEQEILDCVANPDDCGGTGGCGGGTPELAFAGINQRGGLASEWTYPYVSYNNPGAQQCQSQMPMVQVSNFTVLPTNQYGPVLHHLAFNGPLVVNVDASSWGAYESGVFDGCNQTNPDIDHVVQLVGYGVDSTLGPFWIIRNSWNPTFGEDGYIRLMRHPVKQVCGIDLKPSDGTGCNNGPAEVTVCGTCGVLFDTSYPTVVTPSP